MPTHAHQSKFLQLTINVTHVYGGWVLRHFNFEHQQNLQAGFEQGPTLGVGVPAAQHQVVPVGKSAS
jgi:hypothetical protein